MNPHPPAGRPNPGLADPILDKVRKLLTKAEDPAATPHEAEVYTAKATQLIADYGIDQALLARSDPTADPVGDLVVTVGAPYAADKIDLLGAVAGRLRCAAVRTRRRGVDGDVHAVHLFGHASDLRRVELLYTSLLLQATSQLARTPVPSWEHKAAFRRSWLAGFRMAVVRRLAETEDRAEQQAGDRFSATGTSAALVLADRTADAEAALRAAYPRVGSARPRSLSGSGMPQGWGAGQRADLAGARVGPQARRSLGR
ncbi:DUF2786 domain-containing protein [Nocardioides mesophilus]|uniref:DUF2786 domain-containing protein n=1 Tax=Nocardioides mesophilus TaxID=433659 RepID=A0A7G9R750_9ACTN|nr:DUF2786 domain-containing protein [Nocardioides mesophilus]QNN51425.1 DUF2786 domain-containing protein [Nocardioides mesophilus]